MPILHHFDRTDNTGYVLYRLKTGASAGFLGELPDNFRRCYITDDKLNELSKVRKITKAEFLEKYIIPDDPTIKSGDFGELLCFHAVIENFGNKGMVLFAPKKWLWKDSRNVAAPGSDAIMFYISSPNKSSKKDLLITIESKMKAVSSSQHRVQDAVDGATKDKMTRMAKTLSWLEERYAKAGDEENRKIVERFLDPATHGQYKKRYKAIAIVDSTFELDELAKVCTNPENVSVLIFSIAELKKVYEDTRKSIFQSV